jgi:hypothetical protein
MLAATGHDSRQPVVAEQVTERKGRRGSFIELALSLAAPKHIALPHTRFQGLR